MAKYKKQNIIPQMFDVRPVDENGDFDLAKAARIEKVAKILPKERKLEENKRNQAFSDIKKPDAISDEIKRFQKLLEEEREEQARLYQLGRQFISDKVPVFYEMEQIKNVPTRNLTPKKEVERLNIPEFRPVPEKIKIRAEKTQVVPRRTVEYPKADYFSELENFVPSREIAKAKTKSKKIKRGVGLKKEIQSRLDRWRDFNEELRISEVFLPKKKLAFSFAGVACLVFLAIFGTSFVKKGFLVKNLAMDDGRNAYAALAQAKEAILSRDFHGSEMKFNEAFGHFNDISKEVDGMGSLLVDASRFVPYLSKLSTGSALAQAGKDISRIGVLIGQTVQTMDGLKNPLEKSGDGNPVSLLKLFQDTNNNISEIQVLLADAQKNIDKVDADDIPEAQRVQFAALKNQLPEMNKFLAAFAGNSQIFTDVLGGNGPRKYLFLFQNNNEMRPTGGFIGTYGVMDISNGRINKFFIDGIFNPDGQLQEKVVPPAPIQKISAAWSLHDSNWFPDFPASAEKAALFYEKTGGPTVDGVITMTPVVMQKLLEVTGPIEMPDYDVTIDKDNFMEKVQQEVEVDYDKELNQPKKILADLAPKILDRIFNARNFSDIARTTDVLVQSLDEKQILIYSKKYDIEKELSALGWSGEVLDTRKDYLSVINTNINGYKTDGVIEEKIEHQADIQDDGSVVDTVTITRHHNGGNSAYEWFNKVNADYMRVYVLKGSQLLSAEGQTREFNSPPLDYDALNFKRDPQVQSEEESTVIDQDSGTRVSEDAGKTVFGNWVYVSPQETVTVKYKYLLPFKLNLGNGANSIDTYSLLAQKQSGSIGSQFVSSVSFPGSYKIQWKYPDGAEKENNILRLETNLKTDKFIGVAFSK